MQCILDNCRRVSAHSRLDMQDSKGMGGWPGSCTVGRQVSPGTHPTTEWLAPFPTILQTKQKKGHGFSLSMLLSSLFYLSTKESINILIT